MRGVLLAAALLLVAGGGHAAPRTAPVQVTADLEVIPLADGVWLHRSWRVIDGGTRFPSNGLLVRDGDGIVLVDTAWGDTLTAVLLAWADTALAWPVRLAIGTHAHDDRIGGCATLSDRGIPLKVSPATHRRLSLADAAYARIIPQLHRTGDAVRVGGLEVFAMGPAHAPDNVAVWLPRQRVLFGGCAVRPATSTSRGNVADADTLQWSSAIMRLQLRYARALQVVPGHGDVGGTELLAHTRRLLPRVVIDVDE